MRNAPEQRSLTTRDMWWRDWLYEFLPKPRTDAATLTFSAARPITGFLVLSKHENPSYTYYLSERLDAVAGRVPVISRCIDDASLDNIDPHGKFVVICRYIKSRQLSWLERNAEKLSGVGLFIDDDMAALIAGKEASWAYKARLFHSGVWPLRRLNRLLTVVWVSTTALRQAVSHANSAVHVLPPLPDASRDIPARSHNEAKPLTLVYHATGIHRHEHLFLAPIIKCIMHMHPDVHFEVTADGRNASVWRKLNSNRIRIKPLLAWKEYLADSLQSAADIALVPLLSSKVNLCRSDTKRIDVSRLNAAAVFSECAVFDLHRQNGEIHVQNSREHWITAIDELIRSPQKRQQAALATKLSVASMIANNKADFPGLLIEPTT